ncbi:MAG: hypothetical protein IJX63_13720 [Lachnospiraceae bacterium]|nr:hypothetical protein [Lachnospiraceae bacterium]
MTPHTLTVTFARPFHAIDEMDNLIGGFDGLLPYSKEIERCGTSGQMFKALGYCNQRYVSSLKLVKNRLEGKQEEIKENVRKTKPAKLPKGKVVLPVEPAEDEIEVEEEAENNAVVE